MLSGIPGDRFGILPENAEGQRIGKNVALFENLMRSAMSGGAPGGEAWLSQLHG